MSLQGIMVIDLMGLGFIILLINLVRTQKLNVSYAIIWLGAVLGLMSLVSVPELLNLLPRLFGAIYPASALSLLGFVFIFLVLIFMSVKLSQLSARQVELIQLLAQKELEAREREEKAQSPQKLS
ncbi:MAG: DUF2304 domain-containing protein [Calditrichaeota bacterium]|nr:DUF2304 domain-containing protein [Calditrichota bacterium]MCB0297697.1 DUF2304 domain-containing protein [Calditrichota bacterium]